MSPGAGPPGGRRRPGGAALLRDEAGGMIVVFGLMLPILLGFAALTVDAGYLYTEKSRLQLAADAAALAAARELPDAGRVTQAAKDYVLKNRHSSGDKATVVDLGRWNPGTRAFEPGGNPADAVRVRVNRTRASGDPVPTFFAAVLGFAEFDVSAEAIALPPPDPVCMLALDPSSPKALNVGNGTLTADGCSVRVNSSAADAIHGESNGSITSAAICVTGGYDHKPTYAPAPETGCPAVDDPLADLPAPTFGGCDQSGLAISSGDATLSPGVYCGGLDLSGTGTITFQPGLYVIKDGTFAASGGAQLVGDGVTFFVTGTNAAVDLSGGGALHLSAPTTGVMAGVLFFGDRGLKTPTIENEEIQKKDALRDAGYQLFRGGADVHLEGAVYFPSTDIAFLGNASGLTTSPHSTFIARRLLLTGNGELGINSNYAASSVPRPTGLIKGAKLVR